MKRSVLNRRTPLRRTRGKSRPTIPAEIREEVKARTHGLCHLCLHDLGYKFPLATTGTKGSPRIMRARGAKPIVHLHHVFSVQRWPELAKTPANLIGLCLLHHLDHEFAAGCGEVRRIPREALPVETLLLAVGDGPRLNELDRRYPGRPA